MVVLTVKWRHWKVKVVSVVTVPSWIMVSMWRGKCPLGKEVKVV